MELIEILKRPEGKTLEFKRDLSSPTGLVRTAVAFANTSGGTILVGVEDRTRRVLGVNDPLSLEERVASLLSDSIAPRLLPDLELLCYRRSQVLAVGIHPSSARPHLVVREGAERGIYVRVGSTNRRADVALIAEMRRFAAGEGFDEEPLPDLDSEALDFRAASELFAPVRRLARRYLQSLRLVTLYHGRKVPTVGGLLLFGLTIEDLPRGISKLRNRVIGRVFHELGLVEMWGSGAQRMIAACTDSGLPVPRWEEVGLRLRVTLFAEPLAPPAKDDPDRTILELLADGEGHGTSELAAAIGLTTRATRTRLRKLVERGVVREIGKGPRDPRRRYYLAGEGERT